MRFSSFAAGASLAAAVSAIRFSNTTTTGLVPTQITTEYAYLCPTGIKTVPTVISTSCASSEVGKEITTLLQEWTTYVTICTVCEEASQQVTLTLPSAIAPTGPASGPVTTGDVTSASASATAGPIATRISSSAASSTDIVATAITTEYVYQCPTGLSTVNTIVTALPASFTPTSGRLIPGWYTTVTECDVCGNGGSSGTATLTLPPDVAPSGGLSGPSTTAFAGNATETGSSGSGSGSSGSGSTGTGSGDVYVTSITTDYVYMCPTGLTTAKTVYPTTLPVGSTLTTPEAGATTSAASLPAGWTTTVTICTLCEGASTESMTFTLPPNVGVTGPVASPTTTIAIGTGSGPGSGNGTVPTGSGGLIVSAPTPTGGESAITSVIKTSWTDIGSTGLTVRTTDCTKTIPATASGTTLSVIMTTTVTICTVCENGGGSTSVTLTVPATSIGTSPTGGSGSGNSTSGSGSGSGSSTSELVPVISGIPTATGGEAVVTTIIATTWVDVCPTGLTTKSTQVTTEIPATATNVSPSIIMTTAHTICTACGAGSSTVVVTKPAETSQGATAPLPSGTGSLPAISTTSLAPVLTGIPSVSSGEEVITTIIKTTWVDVCPTGLTTKSTQVTTEIPATATGITPSIIMTTTETICTACSGGSSSIVITKPVESSQVVTIPQTSAQTTAAPQTSTTLAPVVSVPIPSSGESVITTVIQTSFVDICPTGLTTKSTQITKAIPATASGTTLSIIMTTTETYCSVCSGGAGATVTLTTPIQSSQVITIPASSAAGTTSAVGTKPAVSTTTQESSTTLAPVISAPTVSSGESAVTTIIRTTFVDVCPSGLTTKTTEVTKTIPATLTTSITFEMTTTATLCTACGTTPTSVIITKPIESSQAVPAPSSSEISAVVSTPVASTPVASTPAISVPIVSAPSATSGEEVVTTVIRTSFVDICPTGLTTKTTEVTKTIPATATASTITFQMTVTSTVCTVCGTSPSTIALTVPEISAVPSTSESSTPVVASTPVAVSTTQVPIVSVPTTTSGEEVITTVIRTSFVDVCPSGLTTKTTAVTHVIPATASASTITFEMTTTATVCTACAAGSSSVIVTIPAVQQTTIYSTPAAATPSEIAATSSISTPEGGFATTVIATAPPAATTATEEMSTVIVTASYVTLTGTSLSTVETVVSLTRAATETVPATIPMTTSTTVCTACGSSGEDQTITLTVPGNTNTLTVYPTSFVTLVPGPSAGISLGLGNHTLNSTGTAVYSLPMLAAQTSALTQQVGAADRNSAAYAALFGGMMAAIALL